MGAFVISKRFDDRYKFVFTSRKGKTIFTSPSYELKMECEECIEEIKANIEKYIYVKSRAANGKYFFKMMLEDNVIASSRRYTTPLLLQKGIDEIIRTSVQSDVLDFTINDFVFLD
ncbi:DUF1508 domain-containing protein [Flavobacterium cellulosilyticum]|uniref:DUF1508 domain-containing protein n=1 Tax=Flavobacterium cellulosilyticum TaxID=2541731 RepID=A0A4R5CAN6_9FLAO|nr:DUF1508 domain-containing protein [Flavobacterium cellulosilyticum]TDD95260.1 DUF1508 domain-containing protein [Flavobacterium cellulosilyticum]